MTWGDALTLVVRRAGTLNPAIERIREQVGELAGNRNTFAKLYNVERPEDLAGPWAFRAWLLLVTIGEEPNEWGVPDRVIPPIHDPARLRELLPRLDSNQQPAGYAYPQVSDLAEAC